jgi:hypothetical protein
VSLAVSLALLPFDSGGAAGGLGESQRGEGASTRTFRRSETARPRSVEGKDSYVVEEARKKEARTSRSWGGMEGWDTPRR